MRWISDPEAGLVRSARRYETTTPGAPERTNEARLTRGRRTVLDGLVISRANGRAREGSMSSARDRRRTRRWAPKVDSCRAAVYNDAHTRDEAAGEGGGGEKRKAGHEGGKRTSCRSRRGVKRDATRVERVEEPG